MLLAKSAPCLVERERMHCEWWLNGQKYLLLLYRFLMLTHGGAAVQPTCSTSVLRLSAEVLSALWCVRNVLMQLLSLACEP